MPNYTFRCLECGEEFERWFSFHEEIKDVTCPHGHTRVERVLRPPAVIFKGSGFYVTDNRSSNSASRTNGKQAAKKQAAKETAKASDSS